MMGLIWELFMGNDQDFIEVTMFFTKVDARIPSFNLPSVTLTHADAPDL